MGKAPYIRRGRGGLRPEQEGRRRWGAEGGGGGKGGGGQAQAGNGIGWMADTRQRHAGHAEAQHDTHVEHYMKVQVYLIWRAEVSTTPV